MVSRWQRIIHLFFLGQSDNSFSYWLANTLAFSKIKEALGLNHCHGFYAAAAPMSMDTLNYFLSIDIRILEIYGMNLKACKSAPI